MYLCPQIAEEWRGDRFKIHPSDEDIHTANERRLKVRCMHYIFLYMIHDLRRSIVGKNEVKY